jgi:hypothetical protein
MQPSTKLALWFTGAPRGRMSRLLLFSINLLGDIDVAFD